MLDKNFPSIFDENFQIFITKCNLLYAIQNHATMVLAETIILDNPDNFIVLTKVLNLTSKIKSI